MALHGTDINGLLEIQLMKIREELIELLKVLKAL